MKCIMLKTNLTLLKIVVATLVITFSFFTKLQAQCPVGSSLNTVNYTDFTNNTSLPFPTIASVFSGTDPNNSTPSQYSKASYTTTSCTVNTDVEIEFIGSKWQPRAYIVNNGDILIRRVKGRQIAILKYEFSNPVILNNLEIEGIDNTEEVGISADKAITITGTDVAIAASPSKATKITQAIAATSAGSVTLSSTEPITSIAIAFGVEAGANANPTDKRQIIVKGGTSFCCSTNISPILSNTTAIHPFYVNYDLSTITATNTDIAGSSTITWYDEKGATTPLASTSVNPGTYYASFSSVTDTRTRTLFVVSVDSDGDGIIDEIDKDSDNDGIVNSTTNGIIVASTTDIGEQYCNQTIPPNGSFPVGNSTTGAYAQQLLFFNTDGIIINDNTVFPLNLPTVTHNGITYTATLISVDLSGATSQITNNLPPLPNWSLTRSNFTGNNVEINYSPTTALGSYYNVNGATFKEVFLIEKVVGETRAIVSIKAESGGIEQPVEVVVFDGEITSYTSNSDKETQTIVTTGTPFKELEIFPLGTTPTYGPSTIEGVNTQMLTIHNTDTNRDSGAFSGLWSTTGISPVLTYNISRVGGRNDQGFGFAVRVPCDYDNDGVANHLDLDSDNDGCSDAIEGSSTFTPFDLTGDNALKGDVEETTTSSSYGIPLLAGTGQTIGDSQNATVQSTNCDFKLPIITQTYRNGSDYAVEITNINTDASKTVPVYRITLAKYNSLTDFVTPSSIHTLTGVSQIQAGQSLLIKSSPTLTGITTNGNPIEQIASSLSFTENNVLALSSLESSADDYKMWGSRYDISTGNKDKSSNVRADDITNGRITYASGEWVTFVNDAIPAYGDNTTVAINPATQRHNHAPLLSEVQTPNAQANNGLGLHRFGATHYTAGTWNNGYPDRSRRVFIDENYNTTDNLSARVLTVTAGRTAITDKLIKVTDATVIEAGAEVRLLGNSQLILTLDGLSSIDAGTGNLLKDQHSNINVAESIYRYNYWSSPVSEIRTGETDNTGNTVFTPRIYTVRGVMKDGSTPLSATSATPADINFVSNTYNGSVGSPINIASYWLWRYFDGSTRNDWFQVTPTTQITAGLGYTMKGTGAVGATGQNYTFVGKPHNGNITHTISGGTTSLLGNPYPSTLDAFTFIKENEGAIDGNLYFWEHTGATDLGGYVEQHGHYQYQGGYSMRNLSMGVAANNLTSNANDQFNGQTIGTGTGTYHEPGRYIAIGQGFFVASDTDGGTVTFSNKQRATSDVNNPPYFMRATNATTNLGVLPILKLGYEYFNENNLGVHRQLGISFSQNNSFNYDYGFDTKLIDEQPTDAYWDIPELGEKSVIVGVEEISSNLEIPLGIVIDTTNTGTVYFMIDEIANINQPIYLLDKLNDISYPLSSPVQLNLAPGEYSSRFYLAFAPATTLSTISEDSLISDVAITLNTTQEELVIYNTPKLEITKIELYNLLGQKINQWQLQEVKSRYNLRVNNLATAVYLVKIYTQQGNAFTRKVINKK